MANGLSSQLTPQLRFARDVCLESCLNLRIQQAVSLRSKVIWDASEHHDLTLLASETSQVAATRMHYSTVSLYFQHHSLQSALDLQELASVLIHAITFNHFLTSH